ncbi:MAG: hypothetical protein GF401_19525 [Chitinivibrionales bacterium]|nr:hypothetical protein [Chitinivibrionales bacterium]
MSGIGKKAFFTIGIRDAGVRLIAAALLFVAAGAFPFLSHAQCGIDSNGYVYLHPWFTGGHWTAAEKKLDPVVLPDAFCTLNPQKLTTTRSEGNNTAAFTTAGGEVYLSQVDFIPPSPMCLCCMPQLVFNEPAQLDLSGFGVAANTPVYLINQAGYTYDTVKLALAGNTDSLILITVPGDASQITNRESLALTAKGVTQTVAAIEGAFDVATSQDTGIFVLGSGGLIRYFPLLGGSVGAEQDLDISTDETVLCYSGGYAGTESGALYRWSGDSFVRDTMLSATPVRAIGNTAAVGDNGAIFIRSGDQWNAYTHGTAQYRAFSLMSHENGSGIELLDENWNHSSFIYANVSTVISSMNPAEIESYINTGDHYLYNPAIESLAVTVNLSDPDGNIQVPSVFLSTGQSLNTNQDGTLQGMAPGDTCSYGKIRLNDSSVILTLTPDSVIFTARALQGRIDIRCYDCNWAEYDFRMAQPWRYQESVTLEIGNQTITISHTEGSNVTSGRKTPSPSHTTRMLCRAHRNILELTIPSSLQHRLRTITLINASGRILHTIMSCNRPVITIPAISTSGMLLVRYELTDGTQKVISVPVITEH